MVVIVAFTLFYPLNYYSFTDLFKWLMYNLYYVFALVGFPFPVDSFSHLEKPVNISFNIGLSIVRLWFFLVWGLFCLSFDSKWSCWVEYLRLQFSQLSALWIYHAIPSCMQCFGRKMLINFLEFPCLPPPPTPTPSPLKLVFL